MHSDPGPTVPEPVAAPDSPAEEVEAVAPAAEPAVAEAEDDIPAFIPVEDDAPVPGPPPPVPEGDRWLCPMCLGVEADRPGNGRRFGLAL